jgi:predicted transcriptional regulator
MTTLRAMERPVKHSTSVRLDDDTRARLDAIAKRDDRSLAYVIRKAIDEYIERHQHDANGD